MDLYIPRLQLDVVVLGVAYSSSLRAEKHYECNLSYSLVCVKS